MEYTIEAKPTKYKGRLYRSRLEARVAAYLTLLNVTFEYEPFDLEGWSPDFLIRCADELDILIEVKPSQEMFNIKKFLKVDYDKYVVWLFHPDGMIELSKDRIQSFSTIKSPQWIQAANEIMFLKPEFNG